MNLFVRKALTLTAAIAIGTSLTAAAAATRTASPSANVSFTFEGSGINGYSGSKIYTGTGSLVRLTPGWSWSGYEADKIKLRVSVQRDTGSGWKTVAADSPLATSGISVRVPTFKTSAKAQPVKYRLLSSAYSDGTSSVNADSYSEPVTVVYENQKKYTGFAKEMYGFMQRYCPQVAVHSVKSIDGNSGLAGQASGSSQFILVRSSEKAKPVSIRKAIALHECSHIRQWLNYGASPEGDKIAGKQEVKYFKNDKAPKRAPAVYKSVISNTEFSALEHAADCSSMALNPNGYLGYGGYCNASELKRAKALMLGKQYSGAPALPITF